MLFVRHEDGGQAAMLLLCRALCVWATWVRAATALPQGATGSSVSSRSASTLVALIPSAPPKNLIPSAPPQTQAAPSGLIPSQQPQTRPAGIIPSQLPPHLIPSQPPPGLIPSQPPQGLIPSQPPQGIIPSQPPSGLIPSGPIPSGQIPSHPGIVPSETGALQPPLSQSFDPNNSNVPITPMPSILSTDQGLRPIPAPTTAPGDPNGHHEIPEPNFSVTAPCKGCSPVIEISVTGFDDFQSTAIAEHQDSPSYKPPKATITAGPSQVVISKEPTGGNFIVDKSTTVAAGQTFTRDNTPIVIQTSAGQTNIIIGGEGGGASPVTIPLTSNSAQYLDSQITEHAILSPITIGSQTVSAESNSHYVIGGQTLHPGGPAITVDGTTLSLMPSATAIVVNGQTSTLSQGHGQIFTTTSSPFLTLNNRVFTANRAGYYVLAPGTTLIPGGLPVTVSGTVISLEAEGTAAIIQGSTSIMAPATTVVTLTRGGGYGDAGGLWTSGGQGGAPQSTSTGKTGGAGLTITGPSFGGNGWLEGVFALGVLGLGWAAVWL